MEEKDNCETEAGTQAAVQRDGLRIRNKNRLRKPALAKQTNLTRSDEQS